MAGRGPFTVEEFRILRKKYDEKRKIAEQLGVTNEDLRNQVKLNKETEVKLRDKIKNLEDTVYNMQFEIDWGKCENLKNEKARSIEEAERMGEELNKLAEESAKLQSDLAIERDKVAKLEGLEGEMSFLQAEVERKDKEIQVWSRNYGSLEHEKKLLCEANARLVKEQNGVLSNLDACKEEVKKLEAAWEAEKEGFQREIQGWKRGEFVRKLANEIAQLKAELKSCEIEAKKRQDIKLEKEDVRKTCVECNKLNQKNLDLIQDMRKLQHVYDDLRKGDEEKVKKIKRLEKHLAVFKGRQVLSVNTANSVQVAANQDQLHKAQTSTEVVADSNLATGMNIGKIGELRNQVMKERRKLTMTQKRNEKFNRKIGRLDARNKQLKNDLDEVKLKLGKQEEERMKLFCTADCLWKILKSTCSVVTMLPDVRGSYIELIEDVKLQLDTYFLLDQSLTPDVVHKLKEKVPLVRDGMKTFLKWLRQQRTTRLGSDVTTPPATPNRRRSSGATPSSSVSQTAVSPPGGNIKRMRLDRESSE